jgi:ABC-type Na+ efflux pump permease subunit
MLGPIFIREWLTLPRRPAHYFARTLYFGAMWVLLLTIWQVMVGWEQPATVGDLARFGLISFRMLAFIQLTLLLFFSALAAASTVALEKDRRTFLLLLLTRLRNDEIVLGKLFGSLMQIALLLIGSMPIFALLMTLGGIDPWQVVSAFLILGATALAAGSLGSLVALWRDKTFQSLALTVLFLVLYLCVVESLSFVAGLAEAISAASPYFDTAAALSWQTALNPFRALSRVIDPGEVSAAIDAALLYAASALTLTVLLNAWGMARLRVWNPSGEPIMQREVLGATPAEPERIHAAPGKVRPVWPNPILWREIATRAYGRRPLLVKTAYFVVLGLVGYYALGTMDARSWAAAYGLVPIGILSLLLISAQSVTSITSERDLGSLDLLIITDISAKEFVYGKILGILYNTKEYIVPPLILVAVYALGGQLGTYAVQGPIYLAIALLILIAFTVMLGIHVALRNDNTRLSAINTLGTVFFLSVGTMVCIYLILINGRFEYQWLSFAGFIVAGIGGLWWVLSAERPSAALNLASAICPIAVFYTITNILIGKPTTGESTDPLIPLIVTGGAFTFALIAMAVPLMSEFDVAVGRSSAIGE